MFPVREWSQSTQCKCSSAPLHSSTTFVTPIQTVLGWHSLLIQKLFNCSSRRLCYYQRCHLVWLTLQKNFMTQQNVPPQITLVRLINQLLLLSFLTNATVEPAGVVRCCSEWEPTMFHTWRFLHGYHLCRGKQQLISKTNFVVHCAIYTAQSSPAHSFPTHVFFLSCCR